MICYVSEPTPLTCPKTIYCTKCLSHPGCKYQFGKCGLSCASEMSCWDLQHFESKEEACYNFFAWKIDKAYCKQYDNCSECLGATKIDGSNCMWFEGFGKRFCSHESVRMMSATTECKLKKPQKT